MMECAGAHGRVGSARGTIAMQVAPLAQMDRAQDS